MKELQQLAKFITNPQYRFYILSRYGFFNYWPDEKYLKRKFELVFDYELDLENPQTFNEKIQWLKLYDRNPLYTTLVDKVAVKEYVANIIGKEYIIPTIGVYNNAEEIDFNKLPNQFVLKCNHNSGLGMYICKDKRNLNIKKIKKELLKGLKQDYYMTNREWPYKNVPRKIIAEQYMEDGQTKELCDYKFFCFNGRPVFCQVISDRSTNECVDFFDMNWQHQNFTGLTKEFPNCAIEPIRPISFDKMKKACEVLTKNIPFIRVDFYEINGKMYFGELTFYPASGFGKFHPNEWNKKIGDWLVLPNKKLW